MPIALVLLVALAAAAPAGARTGSHRPTSSAHARPHRARARASIIGGVEASEGSDPWMAFIVHEQGEEGFLCSGTVVAPEVILTAGHCGEDSETGEIDSAAGYTVVTGNVDWANSPRQISKVSRVVVDPDYNRNLLTDDASLLILSSPTTAPAIALASSPEDDALLQPGALATIAGWGETFAGDEELTERLRTAETLVQSGTYCETNSHLFNPNLELCSVNPPSFDTGGCFGDSGGPLIAPNPVVELGVISHGEAECSTKDPTVYTRADSIASWVAEQIATAESAPAPSPTQLPTFTPKSVVTTTSASRPAATMPITPISPTSAPTAPNEPGLYVTRPSRVRNVRIRVSGDGKHIVGLRLKLPVNCRHENFLPFSASYLSYADDLAISSNHTAQAVLDVPADRESRTGAITLLVHFTAAGSLEGTLHVRIPFRSHSVGLCAASMKFVAKV
jgi:hypothetical protein